MSEKDAMYWILLRERKPPQLADFRRKFGWKKGTGLIHELALKGCITIDNKSRVIPTKNHERCLR